MKAQELLTPQGELKDMLNYIRDGGAASVFGMREYERMIASALLGRFVFVCADISAARNAEEEFAALDLKVALMPQREDVLSCTVGRSAENDYRRLSAITAFLEGAVDVLIVTASALTELYPPREMLRSGVVTLRPGEEHDLSSLPAKLIALGYERCAQVTGVGTFSVRGDIADIWSVGDESACRVEFFGDTVESVRSFDPAEQTTKQPRDFLSVYPATELFISESDGERIIAQLNKEKPNGRLQGNAAYTAVMLEGGGRSIRLSYLLPLCPHEGFADIFAGETVIFDDAKSVSDNITVLGKEHAARFRSLFAGGDTFGFCEKAIYPSAQVDKKKAKALLAFHRTDSQNRLFAPEKLYKIETAGIGGYFRDLSALADDIDIWIHRGHSVTVCCGTAATRERLTDIFSEYGKGRGADLVVDYLPHGGTFFDSKQIIVGTLDIGKRSAKRVIRRNARDAFVLPEVGDYVVHRVHGIGLCESISKLDLGGSERDYIVVLYAGGDKLYLPIENIDSLSKLVASEHPKLSKIGGIEFARVKERIKQSVKDMALGLIELYASRSAAKGHEYSPDDTLLDEFCADFPYAETEDQLIAAEEGLNDLKSGKIMDRLLCGDVGFGKTEVAMRIAFKVVCEGKQVAFISPTTILARQHYETLCERMEKFGVNVVDLTRMTPAAVQKKNIEALKAGKADIVCGTHRVLSKDVGYSDLGLLILDEEQRFGVADKEKIKKLKTNVNVLSLSATPIPRTLHMSLSGIRDISVLDTPPADRLPVQTFVTEYSEALIADAIERELGRGGQVFVVYNRVANIDSFAASIQSLVPSAKVCVAHGQMPEGALSSVIDSFAAGEKDVLVASTIIENGIDMPRANTMIVTDSDRLGLAQMYQLRGRVGRSNRLAYVYFTYDSAKILTETATKRLEAITQFTELSSGFKIAMRDLEIRGAGNLLGREQHGHIEKVGYDTYCKILQAAVEELRGGGSLEEKNDTVVTCDFNAFIPESYVTDKDWRIRLYSRIAALSSESECTRLLADMTDVYGAPPMPAVNLVRVGLIKNLASRIGANRVTLKKGLSQLSFPSLRDLPEYAATAVAIGKGVSISASAVKIKFEGSDAIEQLTKFLFDCGKK